MRRAGWKHDEQRFAREAIALERVSPDPADALWIQKSDLPRINGFEIKPQGACREDICIPIPRGMMRGATFNLAAFAQRVGQKVIARPAERVWSLGEIPVVRGSFLEGRMAPDFAVPDRSGRPTGTHGRRRRARLRLRGVSVRADRCQGHRRPAGAPPERSAALTGGHRV